MAQGKYSLITASADAQTGIAAPATGKQVRLLGFSVAETNNAAAKLRLVNGRAGDQVTNGAFAADTDWTKGTDWTIAAGKATRAAGAGATSLSQALASPYLIPGVRYSVAFTMSLFVAGTCTPVLGGTAGTARGSDATHTETILAGTGGSLAFLATAAGDFSIDDVTLTPLAADICLAPISLAANGFVHAWFGPEGIEVPDGLSVDYVSGQFDLTAYYKGV